MRKCHPCHSDADEACSVTRNPLAAPKGSASGRDWAACSRLHCGLRVTPRYPLSLAEHPPPRRLLLLLPLLLSAHPEEERCSVEDTPPTHMQKQRLQDLAGNKEK